MSSEISFENLELPVSEVIIMEDRGRVIRKQQRNFPAGFSRWSVSGISPVVVDKTLQARFVQANDNQRVVSAKVIRELKEKRNLSDDDMARMQQKRGELYKQVNKNDEDQSYISQDISKFTNLECKAWQEIASDASWGKDERERWEKELAAIREEIFRLHEMSKSLRKERVELEAQVYKMNIEIAAADQVTSEFVVKLELTVDLKMAGQLELEINYVVPGVCWRPAHTATLKETGKKDEGKKSLAGDSQITFQAEACVWQCTGENWKDVQLFFSTQRPSLGTKPPELSEDLLKTRPKAEKVVVAAREQTIQTAGLGQSTEVNEMPGIDDGGEALNIKAAGLATIPSDGMAYRVAIFTMSDIAETELVCMPELASAVILQSTQTNKAKFPLLAGPVDLIRNTGRVGRTKINFVAKGEKFKLGWGPDAEIRVVRWVTDENKEPSMISSWIETKKNVYTRISNLGTDKKTISLAERVPISEIEQVEILFHEKESPDGNKPDENGIVKWSVPLDPYGKIGRDFSYTVKKKKSVEGNV